jgi:hypothetical protein
MILSRDNFIDLAKYCDEDTFVKVSVAFLQSAGIIFGRDISMYIMKKWELDNENARQAHMAITALELTEKQKDVLSEIPNYLFFSVVLISRFINMLKEVVDIDSTNYPIKIKIGDGSSVDFYYSDVIVLSIRLLGIDNLVVESSMHYEMIEVYINGILKVTDIEYFAQSVKENTT